jgi:hypothetical protein
MQSDIELRKGAFTLVPDTAGQGGGDGFPELGLFFVGEAERRTLAALAGVVARLCAGTLCRPPNAAAREAASGSR